MTTLANFVFTNKKTHHKHEKNSRLTIVVKDAECKLHDWERELYAAHDVRRADKIRYQSYNNTTKSAL